MQKQAVATNVVSIASDIIKKTLAATTAIALVMGPYVPAAMALPQGGQVVNGTAALNVNGKPSMLTRQHNARILTGKISHLQLTKLSISTT